MTRLELAKLQLERAWGIRCCSSVVGGAHQFFKDIVTREKDRLIEIGLWENAAAGLEPFWARERALEVRGPRNEDPICECYSVSGDNPYCKWHNEDPIGGSIQEWMGDFVPRYLSTGERWDDELNCYVKGETP